ncbi:MAG: Tex family protein [Desulfovibrionaceae bacterium]
MSTHAATLAAQLHIQERQVDAVVKLLDEDATVPFIARYRKEATGSLDEVAVMAIRDGWEALHQLDKRREAMIGSLDERALLTEPLRASLYAATTLTALEDVYLPYRPKRRTRASMAREKGLEALADILLRQDTALTADTVAQPFVRADKAVPDVEAALAGARDILAENFAENAQVRERLRALWQRAALVQSKVIKGKDEEGAKFRDYFAWTESLQALPSHRVLALLRGEAEGFLRVHIGLANDDDGVALLHKMFVRTQASCGAQVLLAVQDSYKRLLASSLETEFRANLKKKADAEAIAIFATNLRQLLLAPALGNRSVLAVDPGFRTGCKVVCLNAEGKLLDNVTINPHAGSAAARTEAGDSVLALLHKYQCEVVAVGNGTAGRETEQFLRGLAAWPRAVPVVLVSESGASVYSASEVARAEFPHLDLTYRGAVSIGRRLMDPLAELVKIDPKAIGVGQYQHDVQQNDLKRSLDDVVMSCVNAVGVDVNTASEQLLTYVSGLGPTLAKNIVQWRNEAGAFDSRRALLRVPRLGPKAFEQAAGFLRVRGGSHVLDASAVHPESYTLVERMAHDYALTLADLLRTAEVRRRIDLQRYVSDSVGMPTLTDIMAELEKPGRDPRPDFTLFSFTENVNSIDDLTEGMRLPGIVTNITAFGAFVDIGVHQDGLVHISQLADTFVKNPAEVVRLQQEVLVTVLEVDTRRKRIALSMKKG